ncbi:hypothetical protein DTO169E5_5954 [Paecilomyces variotii]|nr:hypothetical protein DTO169E5_5954 [Paecilomyces variotii]
MALNLIVLFPIILILLRIIYERIRDSKLPPGPPRLPLIGNLHQAPAELPWRTFREWTQRYGPIISAQFGHNTVIMIGDAKIARDLLVKRGHIYSDRPQMVMANNVTKGLHLLFRRYNERYKLHQRLDAPVLSPRASITYHPVQDLESRQSMHDLLSTNNFTKVFERFSASVIYGLAYGTRLHTGDEVMLKDAHRVQQNFVYAARVGTWIVDAVPILNYLPRFLAPWKKIGDEFYELEKNLHLGNMCTGFASKSWNWTKEFSKSKEAATMSQIELAYNVGILADAGLDTTQLQMRMFVLAALSYPGFIPKAQKELDEVVGPDRLPTFEDQKNLPYISAIVEENLRWRGIIPGGVPHATLQEDNYMGYRIPKGATIVWLAWAMALDEHAFERPLEFIPERWLEESTIPDGKPRFVNFFGYSRRICTGRHIARNSLFILIARVLWGFNIKNAVDERGNVKEVDDMAMTSGFVQCPMPFEAVFEPRSAHAKAVIENSWHTAEKNLDVIMDSVRESQIAAGLKVQV